MTLSNISQERLRTCHPDLIRLMLAVAEDQPTLVICGHRGEKEQNDAYAARKSKLRWPMSSHNATPSRAVDAAPLPLNWNDTKAFMDFGHAVLKKAAELGIKIRWGGDFNGNGRSDDERFLDLVHFELA